MRQFWNVDWNTCVKLQSTVSMNPGSFEKTKWLQMEIESEAPQFLIEERFIIKIHNIETPSDFITKIEL